MSVEEQIKKLTTQLFKNQESSNMQSTLFTNRLDDYFSNRIDRLTDSINKSSEASGKLTKVIICVAVVAVAVEILKVIWITS
jgi:hypothetical protein